MVKVLLQGRQALFHSMLGWVASVLIQFVTEVQTHRFADTNQSSPLLKCWRAVKWAPWPFTWTAWEILSTSSTGPDHLGSAHFLLRTFTHNLLPLLWHLKMNPGGCFGPLLCKPSLFAQNFKLVYHSQYVASSVCFSPWGGFQRHEHQWLCSTLSSLGT